MNMPVDDLFQALSYREVPLFAGVYILYDLSLDPY